MKKGLAIFLVLSLMVSLLAPFSVGATGNWPGTETTEVGGEGQNVTFQTHGDILGGNLPTGSSFNFVIDPLGLMGLTKGDTIADATPTNRVTFGGSKTDGDVINAWSTSSVPVVLSVDLSFHTAGSTAVLTEADVTTNGDTNILMWVEPSAKMATNGDTFAGLNRVIAYGTDGDTAEVRFLLDEVAYALNPIPPVGADGVLKTNRVRVPETPDSHGTALRFGGIVNIGENVNWEDVGTMRVRVVFSMEVAYAAALANGIRAVASDTNVVPYGWLNEHATSGATEGTYTPPALIAMPEVRGATVVVRVAAGEWFSAPGVTSQPEVLGITVDGTDVPLPSGAQTWWNAADGDLGVSFPSPGTFDFWTWSNAGGEVRFRVIVS